MTIQDIVSDEEVESVHGDIADGSERKRDYLSMAVLKVSSGNKLSANEIAVLDAHGLMDARGLTQKGRSYLWAAFGSLVNS